MEAPAVVVVDLSDEEENEAPFTTTALTTNPTVVEANGHVEGGATASEDQGDEEGSSSNGSYLSDLIAAGQDSDFEADGTIFN